jgi:hypothetical protein
MTTDDNEQRRLADLRRQHVEFIAAGGYGIAHNRKPGGAVGDRRTRNKRRRQRTRALLRDPYLPEVSRE